jgi:hypothetical protein
MAYRRTTMRGQYSPLNFPLPSNSLSPQSLVPAAAAAVKAAANLSVKKNGNAGMAGAYAPPAQRWPGAYSRRGMAVMSGMGQETGAGFTDWIKNNPLMSAGIAIGAVLLLGMGGKRWRR